MLCLEVPTDAGWVEAAMSDVDAVLVDHAHCEMKAASNALSLAARHPGDLELVRALTDLAREEIEHFQRVLRLLEERGVALGAPPVDAYAADLRRAANALPRDPGPAASLVDRLLVGALIEARSCERFKLLADATASALAGQASALAGQASALAGQAPALAGQAPSLAGGAGASGMEAMHALWSELLAAEARHYRTFVDLATRAAHGDRARVAARLEAIAHAEGAIVAGLARDGGGASRATIHG